MIELKSIIKTIYQKGSTRSRSSDNKVASMDKILGDMKKRFENEHKQIVTEDDTMLLVNDNFTDDLNPNPSELISQQYEQLKEQQQQIPDEKMDSEVQPTEPNRAEQKEEKQQLTSEETIQQETEMITNQEMNIHQPQMEQKEPEKVIDYIETSTPYPAVENMNDSEDKKDEKHLPIEQIDSIRSNNRDESSDDKTNELSDTTEEIETFTRKETNQYRVLNDSAQESHNEQEVSNQTELNESEQIETIQVNLKKEVFLKKSINKSIFKSKTNDTVQQIEQEEMKEIDSTTYKSQSSSPVKTNQQETEIETINREEEFVINEAKTNLFTSSSDLIEEDPLISQDLSNATISNENSQTEMNSHLNTENL